MLARASSAHQSLRATTTTRAHPLPCIRPSTTMPRTSGDPYNRLYEGMLPFHAHFRHSYASIQRALPLSQSLPRRNLEMFLLEGIQLCQRLEMHHRIEETYIFPLLAKRMPSFDTGKVDGAHREEHAIMHQRLDHFEQYLNTVGQKLKSGQGNKAHSQGCGQEEDPQQDSRQRKPWPRDIYDAEKMKELVDQLGQALFPHLAAEEESLKAKSMRAAGWTEAELARIPL